MKRKIGPKTKKIIKYTFLSIIVALSGGIIIIVLANRLIDNDTEAYTYDSVDHIPGQEVGLILGTARYLHRGIPNPYFTYRIQAAQELYDAGKAKSFVVSGDNGHVSYNEPRDMYQALIEKGIPDSIIYFDYAGFRTLDSVVRMKKIFGQDSIIIISQKFHNQRAIYIAQHHGIKAYGYNAADVTPNRMSFKTNAREKLARVKVFIDILIGKEPKFLGDPIEITTHQ